MEVGFGEQSEIVQQKEKSSRLVSDKAAEGIDYAW